MSDPQPNLSPVQRQRIGVIALVAIGAFFIWRSLVDLPLGTIDNPGPGAMPLVLAALLVVFALWSLKGGTAGLLDDETGSEADAAATEPGALRHAVLVVAAITAAALALDTLGYRLTILALLLFFLLLFHRKPTIPTLH